MESKESRTAEDKIYELQSYRTRILGDLESPHTEEEVGWLHERLKCVENELRRFGENSG